MEQDFFATLTPDDDRGHDLRGAKIELLLSASDLADLDIFSKSDPMCVVFVKKFGQWKELGRTEAEDETLNPKFTESFVLDYDYDLHQHLLFSIYDVDSKSADLRRHDFVGSVETTLSHLLKNGTPLSSSSLGIWAPGDDKCRGHLHVTCEVLKPCRGKVSLHLGAGRLDKRGVFATGKASTILEVSRSINSVDFHPVYRSEVAHKTQSPRWRPFELSLQKLCNGDPNRQVEFSVWYIKDSKEKKKIGSIISTLHDLTKKQTNGGRSQPYHMTSHRSGRKSTKSSGDLRFINYSLDMAYTLLDYVRGGCDLRLIVAIDFTSSNGPIEDPHSLHYLGKLQSHDTHQSSMPSNRTSGWYPDNQYEEAIKLMGSLLGQYDSQETIQAFGFGAKPKGSKKVDDCFALNIKSGKPQMKGIKGLLHAYRKCAGKVTFSGPSRLSTVIEQAASIARLHPPHPGQQHYYVLLIITDGVVNDLDSSLNAAAQATELPLSLAVVGVGPADFACMDLFQSGGDQEKPSLGKKTSRRTNTCFAALRKHNYVTGANMAISRDVMARVSSQLLSYMKTSGITPNKPREKPSGPTVSRDQWVADATDLTGEHDHMDLGKLTFDPISPKMTSACGPSGPMCPTCGSHIQPGQDEVFEISL